MRRLQPVEFRFMALAIILMMMTAATTTMMMMNDNHDAHLLGFSRGSHRAHIRKESTPQQLQHYSDDDDDELQSEIEA
jgi:hypothetical protein